MKNIYGRLRDIERRIKNKNDDVIIVEPDDNGLYHSCMAGDSRTFTDEQLAKFDVVIIDNIRRN